MTIVNELRNEQRSREIAHIMGGNVTEISMKSAEEMLGRSNLWKENWTRQRIRRVKSENPSEKPKESVER
jgi:DNA repair protein RecN (Recombination protein N)